MLRAGSLLALAFILACDDGDDDVVADASTPDGATVDAAPPLDAPAFDAPPTIDAPPAIDAAPDAAPEPFTMSGEIDLTRDTLTPGRTCAEAPQFAVAALSARAATLATAPEGDCLLAGDEVLLINLQGSAEANANVGNWEFLRVAGVAGTAIAFTAPRQRHYGATAGADSGIGPGEGDQKVVLIRVPRYGALTVAAGASVTAAAWDGQVGGVLALRSVSIQVDGALSAARLGYRGGRWSQDGQDCTQNVLTESGESYTGPPRAGTAANGGAAGGIAAAEGPLFNANSPISPSASHAAAGEAGLNANGRTLGALGQAYGTPDAAKLTLGSGASGNLTCNLSGQAPILTMVPNDHRGGGIVVILSGALTVGASGSITATPVDQSRDTASAGGYVYLRGDAVDVGADRVTARGSRALSPNGPAMGMFNHGSVGYVAIETGAPVVGTTIPAATVVAP